MPRADQEGELLTVRVRLRFDPMTHGPVMDRLEGLSASRAAAVISNMLLEWQLLKDLVPRLGTNQPVAGAAPVPFVVAAQVEPIAAANEASAPSSTKGAADAGALAAKYGDMMVDQF